MNSIMETVWSVCASVRNNSKQGVSFRQLLAEVRRRFKRNNLEVKFKSICSCKLAHNEFYVDAYYTAFDEQEQEIPIEVVICHNFDRAILWDHKQVTEFLVQIFDATVHEFKHQQQSKKKAYVDYRPHKDGNNQCSEYLQSPDELDAYALSIAIELCRTLGKYRALRYLRRVSALSRLKIQDCLVSPTLNAYVTHFRHVNSPALKSLAKKVYRQLQKIDTGCVFM